jgi:hypothetical protein
MTQRLTQHDVNLCLGDCDSMEACVQQLRVAGLLATKPLDAFSGNLAAACEHLTARGHLAYMQEG